MVLQWNCLSESDQAQFLSFSKVEEKLKLSGRDRTGYLGIAKPVAGAAAFVSQ